MHPLQLTALIAFALATAVALFGWRRDWSGRALLLALGLSTAWVAAIGSPTAVWLDLARAGAWLLFLVRVSGISGQALLARAHPAATLVWASGGVVALTGVLLALGQYTPVDPGRLVTLAWLGVALSGLVLVEQLLRNTLRRRVWSFKFIPLGVALLFGADFLFHADAMLFGQPDPDLARVRPLFQVLALPLLVVGSLRSRDQHLSDNLTRAPLLHTGVLTIAGGYLVLQSAAAMYLRLFGGEWNMVLLLTLAGAGVVGLVVLAASASIRARTVAALRQLFGLSRYDYRAEWVKLNTALARQSPDETYEETVLAALMALTTAKHGLLLRVTGSEQRPVLAVVANHTPVRDPEVDQQLGGELLDFLTATDWVPQAPNAPGATTHASQPPGLAALVAEFETTMVLPLRLRDTVWGLAVLGERLVNRPLKTEDYDLFRIAARQATGALAANALSRELAEAEQLTAASQMTSFLLHDLKTIVSQLALLPRNARRHRENPAFVDDMAGTIDHAVAKMQRLVQQLSADRAGSPGPRSVTDVPLAELLVETVAARQDLRPAPQLVSVEPGLTARADRDDLLRVLEHLLHNACDATAADGQVEVTASLRNGMACIDVADTGCGMTDSFVRDSLFRPFNSTKGVTGMGIGTYQSRQLVRAMGGELSVQSAPGEGSRFTIRLPAVEPAPPPGDTPPNDPAEAPEAPGVATQD